MDDKTKEKIKQEVINEFLGDEPESSSEHYWREAIDLAISKTEEEVKQTFFISDWGKQTEEWIEQQTTKEIFAELDKLDEAELAEFMHIEYENAAKVYGWKTQKSSHVGFWGLPEANRKTMIAVILLLKSKIIEKIKSRFLKEREKDA